VDECLNKRMSDLMGGWMRGLVSGWMGMTGWVDGWPLLPGGRMDGRVDEWRDGWGGRRIGLRFTSDPRAERVSRSCCFNGPMDE